MRAVIRNLGWWSFVLLVVVSIGLIAWWRWDQGRQLPLPSEAQGVEEQILGSLAKRTTFAVPLGVDDVRAFYRDVLPQRGWSYCGTQATPRCTNMVQPTDGTGDQVDVYRRATDQDFTGTTIEVWAAENASGGTQASVYEANPPP